MKSLDMGWVCLQVTQWPWAVKDGNTPAPTGLPCCPIAVFAGGMDVTELHVGPAG